LAVFSTAAIRLMGGGKDEQRGEAGEEEQALLRKTMMLGRRYFPVSNPFLTRGRNKELGAVRNACGV